MKKYIDHELSKEKEKGNNQNFKVKIKKKRTYKKKIKRFSKEEIVITRDTIHIFTDGSAKSNPGPCGAGCILLYNDHRKDIKKSLGFGTNNVAELSAIKIALETIKEDKRHYPVTLYTDSEYCLGVLCWNWNAKKNNQLIKEIKEFMRKFKNLRLEKVKAHFGHKYNEEVDKLAKIAAGVRV